MSEQPAVPGEVVIKLDASDLEKTLAALIEKQMAELKDILQPKPAPIASTESVPNYRVEFKEWLEKVRGTEAVGGIPTTFTFSRELMIQPPFIQAGLRDFVRVVRIGRGETEARFFKINVPSFVPGTPKTPPPEASQTITTVTLTASERVAMQVIGDEEIERSVVDLIDGVERSLTLAAALDIEKTILNALDANTNVYYAGGGDDETDVLSSNTLTVQELIRAKRMLIEQSKRFPARDVVLVCHPKQYHDLLASSDLLKAADFGGAEPIRRGVIPEVLGINIVVSDQVSTGTGGGSPPATTYRAHMFFAEAVGLAISRDLRIEAFREPPKRAVSLTASYVAGAGLIEPSWALKIVTA